MSLIPSSLNIVVLDKSGSIFNREMECRCTESYGDLKMIIESDEKYGKIVDIISDTKENELFKVVSTVI